MDESKTTPPAPTAEPGVVPIHLKLAGRPVLVVGQGPHARRRAESLAAAHDFARFFAFTKVAGQGLVSPALNQGPSPVFNQGFSR